MQTLRAFTPNERTIDLPIAVLQWTSRRLLVEIREGEIAKAAAERVSALNIGERHISEVRSGKP